MTIEFALETAQKINDQKEQQIKTEEVDFNRSIYMLL